VRAGGTLEESQLALISILCLCRDMRGKKAYVRHADVSLAQSSENDGMVVSAYGPVRAGTSGREIVAVPVRLLLRGESPRLQGENKAHIDWLAETEAVLPPILVERRTMCVIDGMHRLTAASLKGQKTIDVEFFDGSAAEAFLRAVEANVTHGLPLSQDDRRAAAVRIVTSHPHMSDRAIAESTGLAAKTVAGIRRSTGELPQLTARVGRDGRVRPLSSVAGRQLAAELLTENPQASLREIARGAGVSPTTARDVRSRLERGEAPSVAKNGADESSGSQCPAAQPVTRRTVPPPPAAVLEKLLRDPSLRHNERGRNLLRWLQHNAIGAQERSGAIAAVPPHCSALVAQLARHYAQMWLGFAQELDERARSASSRVSRPDDNGDLAIFLNN